VSVVAEVLTAAPLQVTSLGQLAEYVTSGSRDWSKYYSDDGAIFIRTQDINRNRLSLDQVAHVKLPDRVEGKRSLVRRGDLLITITGANVGKVAAVDFDIPEAYVSQSVCLVRLKDPALAQFVQLQLMTRRGDKSALEALAYGLGRPVLNLENIRSVPVLVGPAAAREVIVAEIEKQFSRLDEAAANLRRVQAQLGRYRDSLLSECFGDEPDCALADLIDGGPQNGLYLPKSAYGSGTPILRIDDYQTDWIRPVGELRVVAANESQVEAWALVAGDLIVNRVNSLSHLGKCVSVPESLAGALFESNMMRFRLSAKALPRYVELYLGSKLGKKRLVEKAKWAVNQASINQQDVLATPLPVPDLDQQRRIVAEIDRRLSIVRGVEAEVDANLKRAARLREAILQRAFAGELLASRPQPILPPKLTLIPGTTTLRDSARLALSAEIVHCLHQEPTFGQRKHQKIFHLCEHIARLDMLQSHYLREAAGPADLRELYANEAAMKQQGWYEEQLRDGRKGHRYRALSRAGQHRAYLDCFSAEQLRTVRRLIELMRTWDTDRCEIFSTTYAAWNDLILLQRPVTDAAIVREIWDCWDSSKRRFSKQRWREEIAWMRREAFVPTGFGRPTRGETEGMTPTDLFPPADS